MTAPSGSKIKIYAAVVLSLAAVGFVVRAVLPQGTAPAAAPSAASYTHGKAAAQGSLDPRLHLELLAATESVKYEGRGINIFSANGEPVKIEPVKVSPLHKPGAALAPSGPAAPPPPPPSNLKFFGLVNNKGGKPRAFLSHGDDVWIANEGDVVNRRYKVVRISVREVEIEDLLNSHHESIPLSQS
ncbi:MAG: hypothetical protein P4M01_05155 [Acidobacteriota bacterium]|nr:hypothetical protein [Acidobacteriota bacterium]